MKTASLSMRASCSSFFSKSPNPVGTNHRTLQPCFSFNKPSIRCLNILNSDPNSQPLFKSTSEAPSGKIPSLSCSAVTSFTSHQPNISSNTRTKLQLLISEFQALKEPVDRVKRLLNYASYCPSMEGSLKTAANRVPGCTAQVWLYVMMDDDQRMRFLADSDSEITKGFCSCLISILDGATPEEVLELKTEDLGALSIVGLNGIGGLSSTASRANMVAESEGRARCEPFPSHAKSCILGKCCKNTRGLVDS